MVQKGKIAQEESDFRKESLKIMSKQIEIQKNQGKILQKQTKFTHILALATVILALSAFISAVLAFSTLSEPMPKNAFWLVAVNLTVMAFLVGWVTTLGFKVFFGKGKK